MDFEAQRRANLVEKEKLLAELNINSHALPKNESSAAKKRRLNGSLKAALPPSRTSARIAAGPRASYNEEKNPEAAYEPPPPRVRKPSALSRRSQSPNSGGTSLPVPKSLPPPKDLPTTLSGLIEHYNSWTASASLPNQDPITGNFIFEGHPLFTPNKSPLEILQEGAFGGQYFSPWHSRTLNLTLSNDYLTTLPSNWLSILTPPARYLTSPTYNPELNRHGVSCGQSLSEWEAAGWINFTHDARGWFEWYIRFFLGRRLTDGEDERQVSRWSRCVGRKGRWKRMLLKRYVMAGVRSVFDDGDEEDDGERVSPVMHQTCLHWGYQVSQGDLDEAWMEQGR
jgi:hypothetical protein